jgi:3-oxoadipate enol-lactonase
MPHVKVRDVALYYELHGPPGAPAVVLNNGILMNAATSWALQVPEWSRHFRVLVYDCRGQGSSDHPDAPCSMASHAGDLAGLLDALDIGRAHVAGISYGGEVAQAFALGHPGRVRSLLLADTVSEVGPELRATVGEWRAAALAGDADRFFEITLPWKFSPAFVAAHAALVDDARRRYRQLDLAAVARLCDSFLGVDFTAALAELRMPACVMVGELDALKGRPYAERLHRALPRSELHLIPGAGHASCWERPEEFNTIAIGFLTKASALTA